MRASSTTITLIFSWIITSNGVFESHECSVSDIWNKNANLGYCSLDEQLHDSPFAHRNGNTQFCDIDVINSKISPVEFNSKYWNKKPVLIDSNVADWSMDTFWEISNLLALFPNYKFQTGKSQKLVRTNKIETTMTLREYVNSINKTINNDEDIEEPMYIFDRELFGLNVALFANNIKLPQYISQNDFNISSVSIYGIFMFGQENTGVSFHVHDVAIVLLAKGKKRWFLYPPRFSPIGGLWQGYSVTDWYNNIYLKILENVDLKNKINTVSVNNYSKVIKKLQKYDNKINIDRNKRLEAEIENLFSDDIKINTLNDLFSNINTLPKYYYYKPLECIQNKGQLLYVPNGWLHSVINLNDVIGIALQKQLKYSIFHEQMPAGSSDMFVRANQFLERNDWVNAETFYLKAILMDPLFIEAYLGLATLYLNSLNDYSIAERFLRIGYILNNKHEQITSLLKEVMTKQRKHHLLHYLDNNLPLPS